jgi:hypothetical protein
MKPARILTGAICLAAIAASAWFVVDMFRERAQANSFMAAPDDNEKYPHKVARYRASADSGVRAACTNYTIGLRSILELRSETFDDNFMKWTARATVEYINPIGGVNRTNLEFKTGVIGGEMFWSQK